MDGIDAAREAAARRRVELDQRIQELHARNTELTTLLISGGTNGRAEGSPAAQVRRAEELAQLAGERAVEATRRAAEMYVHSATAHERAARMHNLLAETGNTDAAGHRQRAQDHLRLAAEDRAAAAAMMSGRGAGPDSGAEAGG